MAVNEVIFLENSSPLFDEIIAHRLGLIPLKTDLKRYNLPEFCTCGGIGCTLCQVELVCEKACEDGELIVYSGDMESTDPETVPVNGKIPIVKLGKGKSIIFEAYARLGLGKQHAKWQVVSATAYRYFPDWQFDASKWQDTSETPPETVCPVKILMRAGGKISMVEGGWQKCNLCKACEKADESGAITVEPVRDKFIFFIESTGALTIREILDYAIDILFKSFDEFDTQFAELAI